MIRTITSITEEEANANFEGDLATQDLIRSIPVYRKLYVVELKDLPADVEEELIEEFCGAPVYIGRENDLAYQFDGASNTGFIACPVGKPEEGFAAFTVGSNTYQVLNDNGLFA